MEDLNKKMWYRAVKVLFILSFLFVQVSGFIITFNIVSAEKDTIVKCNNGKEFKSPYGRLTSKDERAEIKKLCGTDASSVAPTVEVGETISGGRAIQALLQERLAENLNYTTYRKDRYTQIENFGFNLLVFVPISVLFWIIKKIFLYIIVGEKFLRIKK